MFDFLKNFTKSDEEKRQEAFSAYLDDTLSPSHRQEFEAMLAEDADLRAEMELAQLLRQQMTEMPRRSVPRSFTLDASKYGVPKKEPLVQAYPFLRAATVMTAFFFVLALGLSVFTSQSGGNMASVAQTAMEPAPAFDMPMEEAEIAMEAPPEETMAAEKIAEDFVEFEEAVAEEPAEEASMESDDFAGTAPMEEAEGVPPTPTLQATATVSSLPRLDATATAVPRGIEPTVLPDEIANAVDDDGETAVTEAQPIPDFPPSQTFSTSQLLLIGLGVLLLVLVVVTLLTRRKI